jgi:hypothetical protein
LTVNVSLPEEDFRAASPANLATMEYLPFAFTCLNAAEAEPFFSVA